MKFIYIKPHVTPCCPTTATKQYTLTENGAKVISGGYALCEWEKKNRLAAGVPAYLLKIKPNKL